MKYLKTFENINNETEPQIGDYVIINDNNIEVKNFIENNIGIIEDININNIYNEKNYGVNYHNIPKEICHKFNKGRRYYWKKDIIVYSNSIEDLEIKLSANKYNL